LKAAFFRFGGNSETVKRKKKKKKRKETNSPDRGKIVISSGLQKHSVKKVKCQYGRALRGQEV